MKGILTDVTKCIGCRECEKACQESNGLPRHIPARQHNGDGLASNKWVSVIERQGRFIKKQCRHCEEPACVSACIVGALEKTKEGPVVYDASKCMGCRYCMMACPYAIPRYSWEDAVPYVRKCTMCDERIKEGAQPACTEACPEGATVFGERDVLLSEAKRRIRENPDKYVNKVYGETEVGGTSVLYVSDVPLEFLGWAENLGNKPLPELTHEALKWVPAEFLGMGAVMGGVWWITGRREKVARAEAEQAAAEEAAAEAELKAVAEEGEAADKEEEESGK